MSDTKSEPWYAVRSLLFDKDNNHYEERTVLVSASSDADALEKAEDGALKYCKEVGGLEYQGYSDSYHIFGEHVGPGTEVFSLIRKTPMSKDDYIERFLDS